MAELADGRSEANDALDVVGLDRLAAAEKLNPAGSREVQGLLADGSQVAAPGVLPIARLRVPGRQDLGNVAGGDTAALCGRNGLENGSGHGVVLLFVNCRAAGHYQLPTVASPGTSGLL